MRSLRRLFFSRFPVSALLLAMTSSIFGAAAGQSPQAESNGESTIHIRVPDAELVNQNGMIVHLYSDLIQDRKAVVINTMFTSCGTICPFIGVRISRLQQSLGGCANREYSVISITVDPATDTPERMRAWGAKFGAGPCWTLLTGQKPQVDAVLQSLRLLPPDKTSHSPSALIGRDGRDDWIQCNVLASQETLLRLVRHTIHVALSSKEAK